MSRIGKKPIIVPQNVTANIDGNKIEIKGPNGLRDFHTSKEVEVKLEENQIVVSPKNLSKKSRQHWGMNRTQIANLIEGVTVGFTKNLDLNGVGYRAALQGNTLKLSLGYSHEIDFEIPKDVKITVPKPTEININGIDQQIVGQVAANIREKRKKELKFFFGFRCGNQAHISAEGLTRTHFPFEFFPAIMITNTTNLEASFF